MEKHDKRIKQSFVIILGSFFISNFYSVTSLIISNEWMSTQGIISLLSNKGFLSSIVMVTAFKIMSIAFIIYGTINLIKAIRIKVKLINRIRRTKALTH